MATSVDTLEREQVDVKVVDCDVHLVPRDIDEVLDHMPEPWRSRLGARRARASGKSTYNLQGAKRGDSYPPSGAPPGSEPEFVHKQLFDDAGVDLALVIPEVRYTVDPEINAAWCTAHNAWLARTWLEEEAWNAGRLYGTIAVSHDDPKGAVEEIERWAGHPKFKQILVSDVSGRPLGFPEYEPVWRAATRHGLPVAMHFTGHGAGALGLTPVGRFQRYVDYHSLAYPVQFATHVASWLCSGVFDRYPELRFVLVEGGFLWYRPLVARLACHWDYFRNEVGAKGRDPMDYVLDNLRFTTQPIEEAEVPRDVARLMDMADADHILMFSSDYPHFDFDDPRRALPQGLSKDVRRRVMCDNALDLYGLPRTRPATAAGNDGGRAA